VTGDIKPNKTEPTRVEATAASSDVDLGAVAAKLQKAKKPHPDPAALTLILFSKLDKDSAKKATDALQKVKGVDKAATKADEKKGEIAVRIAGGEKVTPATLVASLKDAGVTAHTSKEEAAGKTAEKKEK
jgi:outer membrane receptor for ferrienterochelin and colicin